ncbi:hypothetical protein OK349_04445 [Sphingomonas sp. BT-65]|uniref:hypothetical protein n=1 Tax=Sphingomonas sp. BT-65 TaxID=2989821 RepID=UPI002235BAC5|nr:hypothetical protein [Sphingomonas sp. BT-65]MCW4460945.1 hypothetical protein [Sphingomonas sp. BT-65]
MHEGGPDFLALWEEGAGEHPLDRALGLISAVEGMPRGEAAALPLDRRDRALYRIAARLFGNRISLIATCPDCAGETELSFSATDALAVPLPAERIALADGSACRLPDSRDLAAALRAPDPEAALLAAVLDTTADPVRAAEAEAALASAGGLADLTLAHHCDTCGTDSETAFDILDYLWRRISAEAQRLLRDIHVIARAYGWSSEAVLALSPSRRAAHIALIEG